jgi:hypothetical protein
MRRLGPVAVLALLSLFSSCGRKGPILPPLERIPKAVEDLGYVQVGAELRLRWTIPNRYIDGSPLEQLAALQIWKFEEELSEEAGLVPPSPERMRQEAELWADFPQADFATLQPEPEKNPLNFRYTFEFSRSDIGGKRFGFSVKVREGRNRYSDFSSWITIEPLNVAVAPKGLKAEQGRNRIILTWRVPPRSLDGTEPAEIAGYHLYRAEDPEPPVRVNQGLITETRYEDRSIEFGRTYTYWVRAVTGETALRGESVDSKPFEILAKDTFAPSPPKGLIAVPGGDAISLSWDLNRERDLAAYKVWRREAGVEDYGLLTPEGITANSYTDSSAVRDVRYEYTVTAVDRNGNESERSESAAAFIRGGLDADL